MLVLLDEERISVLELIHQSNGVLESHQSVNADLIGFEIGPNP